MPYQDIVFMQGDDADEPLRILYDKHDDSVVWSFPDKTAETVEYLTQWETGEGEIRDETAAGSADDFATVGNYRLTWNLGLSYIGLERRLPDEEYVDAFTQAYAHAMLWANTTEEDADGNPTGESVDPYAWADSGDPLWAVSAFTVQSRRQVNEDCTAFVRDQWGDLADLDPGQAGHDFALTRNGHGAGFWDRGLGDRGDRLTQASKPYGESTAWYSTEDDGSCVHLHDETAA